MNILYDKLYDARSSKPLCLITRYTYADDDDESLESNGDNVDDVQ